MSLCLASTATQKTLTSQLLWLQRLTHQGTLTSYPCWLSMPSQQRDYRPRTFYPGTAFLPGTRPFSWKGTMQANCLSSELECLSLQEEHRTNALKSQASPPASAFLSSRPLEGYGTPERNLIESNLRKRNEYSRTAYIASGSL